MTKWEPFGAFTELEQEMQALLDHIGGRPWLGGFGWRPDTDIYRNDTTLVVEVDLPDIDPSVDLHLQIVDTVLRIEGEKCKSACAGRRLRDRNPHCEGAVFVVCGHRRHINAVREHHASAETTTSPFAKVSVGFSMRREGFDRPGGSSSRHSDAYGSCLHTLNREDLQTHV